MMHEFAVAFGRGLKGMLVATVQRAMAFAIIRAAALVWVSIQGTVRRVQSYGVAGQPVEWLPVFSNIPISPDQDRVAAIRADLARPDELLIGHFGTYPSPVAELVKCLIQPLLSALPQVRVVLIGRGSRLMRDAVLELTPSHRDRLTATGELEASSVSNYLSACDLWLQPYPEGVTTRRTTVMACLTHGRPVVTTSGQWTEDVWAASGAVHLIGENTPEAVIEAIQALANDPARQSRMVAAASELYDQQFCIRAVIDRLEVRMSTTT